MTIVPSSFRSAARPALLIATAISVFALPCRALADVETDLAQAAKSPYDIARFVDTHKTFEWAPLWKALGITDNGPQLMRCEGSGMDCSEELITVLDPPQVIVVLRGGVEHWDEVYLRFRRLGGLERPGPWTFAGYYSHLARHFHSKHELIRFGRKPYLLVTSEDQEAGVGWRGVIQHWFDLTAARLEPAICLSVEDTDSGIPNRMGLHSTGFVVSLESTPVERITVAYNVSFKYPFPTTEDLGMRSAFAVYTRRGSKFVFDAALSKAPKAEIAGLYEFDAEQRAATEDLLRYTLPELKKIATGSNGERKQWLKGFLAECENTPEKREIQAILSRPSPKGK